VNTGSSLREDRAYAARESKPSLRDDQKGRRSGSAPISSFWSP